MFWKSKGDASGDAGFARALVEQHWKVTLQDVMEKKVSIQAAREEYGVVIRSDGGHLEIDWPATQELR